MSALPSEYFPHDRLTCVECVAHQEDYEVESGWRCRDCRTSLGAPKARFGGSRLCKSCHEGGTGR